MNKMLFLQSFLKSPGDVGSVIPSSRFMINRMIKCVREQGPKNVAELGGGTGVITKQLAQLDVDLYVFEKDPKLRELLQNKFPNTPVYADALTLADMLREQKLDNLDCIVSGLPFTLFPKEKREEILTLVYDALVPGGHFVMYQYSTHLRKGLTSMYKEVKMHFSPLNVPPAFVYNCTK